MNRHAPGDTDDRTDRAGSEPPTGGEGPRRGTRTGPLPAPGTARRSGRRRPNGLARAAVRFRPAAFVGTFVALLMAVTVVSACGILLETGIRATVPPTRYADVPVVVAADQEVHLRVGRGEEAHTDSRPVPDRARVDAALLGRLAPLGRAVPDVTFPVRTSAGVRRRPAGARPPSPAPP